MDVRIKEVSLYFLPVETRVPLKFGPETLTHVTCARVRIVVEGANGERSAAGWGETPLSVQWVWPAELSYEHRHEALKTFCVDLTASWSRFAETGHALEIGHAFQVDVLARLHSTFSARGTQMPWLAALVCCSPFDIALHDAYGNLLERPVYETYTADFMNRDLSTYLTSEDGASAPFAGAYPEDFMLPRVVGLRAWHLVGGLDPLEPADLDGSEPEDGYPVLLPEWIERDGLTCLKVKLRGNDSEWDYDRFVQVGEISGDSGVEWLSADFNCTVTDPDYVNGILDRLMGEHPRIYGKLLYVEQPFPYDLESNRIDVHSVAARKPLFMDESAHDWRVIKMGRELGWTGVALKTCKTQTGALLSLCWARAHGMTLMVQDLTNPMLAQIPHLLLAAHAGTIMGVETNSMQFYPDASACEATIHPGLYTRRNGEVDLSSLSGSGFGYRLEEIERSLPAPEVTAA